MKKFLVVLIALLFAGSAFAQDAAPKGPEFKYGVWANAFAVSETTAAENNDKDYSQIRVKPMFTMGIDNVSVVTCFEIDQFFGKGGTGAVQPNGSTNNAGYADADTDQIAVEVKWAYINVKDFFIPGLTATAGLAPFKYSVGYSNDMPQFNLVYDAGMVKIDLAYVKVEEFELDDTDEGTERTENDDIQMYSAKLPLTFGDVVVTPAVLYTMADGQSTDGEYTTTAPSIAINAKAGALSFNADFVYITGKYEDSDTDVKAYAGYANIGYKVSDAFSLNVFGIYATGEGDDADETTSFNGNCGDEIEIGPMFIINDGGNIGQVGVTNEYDKANEGLMAFGLAFNFKADKFSALAQVAYATTTSDEAYDDDLGVVIDEKAIGTEFDLRLSYEVGPKTSFWVEGAYLKGGKYIEAKSGKDCDDPMYYAAGIMT